jgi:chromatin segregation and condensation protein Rec8/ScpA/Scc1 (kleisin family)
MSRILDRLKETPALSFRDLVLESRDRRLMIGVFLALLELVKLRSIRARQAEGETEILISIREGASTDIPLPASDFDSPDGE